jgi:hypothetical protein
VQAARKTEDRATHRKDPYAHAEHGFTKRFHHAGVIARGTDQTSERRAGERLQDGIHGQNGQECQCKKARIGPTARPPILERPFDAGHA